MFLQDDCPRSWSMKLDIISGWGMILEELAHMCQGLQMTGGLHALVLEH